jgi:hypothetical protein
MKSKKLFFLICTFLISIVYYNSNKRHLFLRELNENLFECSLCRAERRAVYANNSTIRNYIILYNMSALVDSDKHYECVRSKRIVVDVIICIHDVERDIYVSQALKNDGIWEQNLVKLFIRMLISDERINVIDIGAHVGQYTLFAAKLNRLCVSVEPFYENYVRIHKSATIQKVT